MQRREFLIKTGLAAATVPLSDVLLAATEPVTPTPGKPSPTILQVKDLHIGSGAPKIISSITGTTPDEVLQHATNIGQSAQVDIAELRMDYLPADTSPKALADLVNRVIYGLQGKPLLATFRSEEEGGKRSLSDADYFGLYMTLIDSTGVDLIDVEMMRPQVQVTSLIDAAHGKNMAVIVSNHDFKATPPQAEIVDRLRHQQALGGDVLKIATMPQSPADVLTLLAASQEMFTHYADRPLLTLSMGPLGVTSRLAGQLSGSALTFASLGSASAPGQLKADAVRSVLEVIEQGARD